MWCSRCSARPRLVGRTLLRVTGSALSVPLRGHHWQTSGTTTSSSCRSAGRRSARKQSSRRPLRVTSEAPSDQVDRQTNLHFGRLAPSEAPSAPGCPVTVETLNGLCLRHLRYRLVGEPYSAASARAGSGTALRVDGKLSLSRSGVATVAKGQSSVKVSPTAVSPGSIVIATLQAFVKGVAIAGAVTGTNEFTTYLNEIAPRRFGSGG